MRWSLLSSQPPSIFREELVKKKGLKINDPYQNTWALFLILSCCLVLNFFSIIALVHDKNIVPKYKFNEFTSSPWAFDCQENYNSFMSVEHFVIRMRFLICTDERLFCTYFIFDTNKMSSLIVVKLIVQFSRNCLTMKWNLLNTSIDNFFRLYPKQSGVIFEGRIKNNASTKIWNLRRQPMHRFFSLDVGEIWRILNIVILFIEMGNTRTLCITYTRIILCRLHICGAGMYWAVWVLFI